MGLKVFVFYVIIGVVGKNWSAGSHLHVSQGILGVLLPKGRVIILILRAEQNSNDIVKWDARYATYKGQEVLHLVEDLCGRGSIKGQGDIFRLLVLGSPSILVMLLQSQKAYPLKFHPHKWLQGCINIS
jgi:hypothetical protein